ncbi:MAG: hypothetical protein K6F46_01980 [Desulfovibrio sp.]|nr:hypothetical protein [Desulfovibrio sp.]
MLVFYSRRACSNFFGRMAHCRVDQQFSDQPMERQQWEKCLASLRPGDTLLLDMATDLGQSFQEAGQTLKAVLDLGVEVVLGEAGKVFKSGDFAEDGLEPERLKALEKDWLNYATSNGLLKSMGRPKAKLPNDFGVNRLAWLKKKISLYEAAELCGMSTTTFWRRCEELA